MISDSYEGKLYQKILETGSMAFSSLYFQMQSHVQDTTLDCDEIFHFSDKANALITAGIFIEEAV